MSAQQWAAFHVDEGIVHGPFPTKREVMAEYRGYPWCKVTRSCGGYDVRYGFEPDDCSEVFVATLAVADRNGFDWATGSVEQGDTVGSPAV